MTYTLEEKAIVEIRVVLKQYNMGYLSARYATQEIGRITIELQKSQWRTEHGEASVATRA